MKKSKFLKKSLAILLALMLVVAMIPLSAAAATPELREVRMSTDSSNWGPPLEASGSTYTGSYDSNTSKISLQLVVRTGNTVYYTDKETNAPVDEVAGGNGIVEIKNLDVNTYTSDGKVVIDFTVADSSDTTVRKSYSVELTPVTASADTSIEKFEINRHFNSNTVPQVDTTKIGVDYISINVPYDAGNGTTYTIRNLELATGATMTITHKDGTTGSVNTDTIVNGNSVEVRNGDKITVKSAAGNTQTYTLYINRLSGFEKFSTKEGLDAIMFPENGTTGVDGAIAVLLPYGTSTGKETITVTPEFELDYASAVAYDATGAVMTSGTSTITYDADDVIWDKFQSYLGTDKDDWTGRKNTTKTWEAFSQGTVNRETPYAITVQYTDDTERTYDVYFYETAKNDAAVISGLTIGSETATIDQEAKTIDITLPAGTDLANLKLDAGETKFEMTASNGAVVSFPSLGVTLEEKVDSNNAAWANRTVTDIYISDKAINATSPIQVKVVPEDTADLGRPAQQETWYTLNITASDNYEEVALTGIKLEGPNGEEVTGKPNANGEIVLEVPYYVYDRDELDKWKLFYSKTAGSAIRYDSNDDGEPDTALPVTGAYVDTKAAYIPAPGSNEYGDAIYVSIVGEDWTANSKQYKIKLNRAAPKTDTTLKSFKLTGEDDYKLVNEANTYLNLNTIDQDTGKITAYVPWSAYQEWTSAEFGAIAKTAEDANAKIVFMSGDKTYYGQYYVPLTNTEDPNAEADTTNVIKIGAGFSGCKDDGKAVTVNDGWVLYKGAKIYVLSEQAWVDAAKKNIDVDKGITAAQWRSIYKQSNGGYIKEYTLDIVRQVPKEGNDIGNVYLVDGTGWRDQLGINVNQLTLTGQISYSFTSELEEDGKIVTKGGEPVSINPVFLAYDDTTRAWVLGQDTNGNKPTKDPNTQVPTAGTNGNGVFEDIANYDFGTYDEYVKAGKPFLLISRKGDVYIYNWNDSNGNGKIEISEFKKNDKLVDNKLVVTNEDGNVAYSPFTFQLGVDPAKSEAAFTSFYFKGYENFRGQIDSDTHTITVTLPYGSEFTYLVPVYEVSEGSIVTVDDPELMGKPLYNGVTDVNFTTTRKFTVIAENETTEIEWTVRVVVSDRFSDVNPGDWFYDNVMDAAEKGYISGMGNGTFEPKTATTRAQFASMIAKAMGYDDTQPVDGTRFSDVAEDQWYTGAINFCYDNGIILGYDDTTFQPGKTISRQEAASILKNAFNLTGSTTELFPDDDQIADWAKDNVYNVKHSGLMKGDADTGNFRPTAMITRAEAASILMNAHRDGLID